MTAPELKKCCRDLFQVGSWVKVGGVLKAYYHEGKRRFRVDDDGCPWVGQVVGATTKLRGRREWLGYDAGYSFVPSDTPQEVWLVRRGMRNTPIAVPPGHLEYTDRPEGGLPWLHIGLSERNREAQSRIMKADYEAEGGFPRDEKGRFVAWG